MSASLKHEDNVMRQKFASLTSVKHWKGSWSGTRVGIITAGDDAQGVNAAIRSTVRMGMFLGCQMVYVKKGFKGLVDGEPENFVDATWNSTSDVLGTAGTFLKSLKCEEFRERSGLLKAAKHLVENSITNLVVIGGDGTMKGCMTLQSSWISLLRELDDRSLVDRDILREHRHLHIMCIPCSITNDICGTDMCIGVDSALHRIVEATDNIATTSSSSQMAFVVEVMGGHSGYLALEAALICDASMVFIPEYPSQGDWREELHSKVRDNLNAGTESIICIVSEDAKDKDGVPILLENVKEVLETKTGLKTKITVLGHFQRGGVPSAYDRLLATRLGSEALIVLKDMKNNAPPAMVSICGNDLIIMPVAAALKTTYECRNCIKEKNFAQAVVLRGWKFQHILNSYNMLHGLRSSTVPDMSSLTGSRKVGILRVGKSSVGHCWVVKSIVGYCQSTYFNPIVIKDGFEGLVKGIFSSMLWSDVKEFAERKNACLGSSSLEAEEVGLDKIANAIETMGLSGLILLGGFPAFKSLVQMNNAKGKYIELDIPMCHIPVTVLNNMPGTDVTIGSDTTLNEIMGYCDKIKRAARGYQNCVFMVETTGYNCGYLATVAGLICGAESAYINQEGFTLETLLNDADVIRTKIKNGVQMGLILRSGLANENYNTEFIHKLFSEEGKGVFTCRNSTIGVLQVGGLPSAQDRSMCICNGFTVAAWIVEAIEEGAAANYGRRSAPVFSSTVLSITGSCMVFEPVSKLVAEANFQERLPMYMWWLRLRPLLKVLSGSPHVDSIEVPTLIHAPNTAVFQKKSDVSVEDDKYDKSIFTARPSVPNALVAGNP